MTWQGFLAVGVGGALGCWLRWGLGIVLNPVIPGILLGTLAANLAGGYLVGVAVEYFIRSDTIAPAWRAFVIVGFLGGLTTFSSFSAEAIGLLNSRELGWMLALVGSHLIGSLVMTYLGMMTVQWLQS